MSNIYRIVPAGTNDIYAAGRDGNEFSSEQGARDAIPALVETFGGTADEWDVVADENTNTMANDSTYRVSLDNGRTYDPSDAQLSEHWDALTEAMDPEAREATHAAVAPCSHSEFVAEYLRRAPADLVIG